MATSRYLNHLDYRAEQDLFEDLVIEQIQLYGYDIWYLPRTDLDIDQIFGEPTATVFKHAHKIEAMMPDGGSFSGDQSIMSKFGFRMIQTTELLISKRRFLELGIEGYNQPRSGDLIWIGNPDAPEGSFTNTIFEINNVFYDTPGFQFGKQYCYKLICETFTYSHEKMRTGVRAIDGLEKPENPYSPRDQDGSAVNDPIRDTAPTFINFDTGNPFGDF